ncbi:MAG: hypothetical protein C0610_16730 [Desulfobacteraceae bacterium]|nr:MAG: hypothetical protein C0610_16730 [Desulfobacteraceae bacterium]
MAINDLHQEYPNRNLGLRSCAKQCYEFGQTIAREPSAAHSNGLDEHAIGRQRQYIAKAGDVIERLNARPIPDRPASHPTDMPINFTVPYIYFTENINGEEVPMNEATQELAENWLTLSVELAKSQSAGIAGSLVEFDYQRAVNNLAVIEQLVDEIEARPIVDLPETALPGSTHGQRTGGKVGAKK